MSKQNTERGDVDATLTVEILLEIGFEKLPHWTVGNMLIYNLGRKRHLSIGSVGTPNEMLYICECDRNDHKKITDLVALHNYDYDGYLSKSKLETLISLIGVSRNNP
jgi:hypothetical protein